MGINLFCLVLVQADESVQDVVASRRVIISALVVREVVLHRRYGELLLESIYLVQEQNYRSLREPPGVADRIEQGERLLHAVDGLVFEEKLIVFGDGDQEEDGGDILETMDPLLTLRTLSTDIEHPVCEFADDECGLSNTGRLNTRPQDILVVWHVVVLRDAGDIVEVARKQSQYCDLDTRRRRQALNSPLPEQSTCWPPQSIRCTYYRAESFNWYSLERLKQS